MWRKCVSFRLQANTNLYSNENIDYNNIKSIVADKYIRTIRSINSNLVNYGKDGKFQIFVCMACKESLLSDWFKLIVNTNTNMNMYDEYSFLRNPELCRFCVEILQIIKQFQFKLEVSLTMGFNI
jgi:hypothetical protein